MSTGPVYLIGGGGFAGEVIEALLSTGVASDTLAGVFDDDTRLKRSSPHGLRYLGTIGEFVTGTPERSEFVIAVGDNNARQRIAQELIDAGKRPLCVVHSQACVSRHALIEPGAYIGAFVFVGPRVYLGAFCLINVGASIGHDSRVEAWAQVCPGSRVSGYCMVGERAFLGSNSGLAPSVRVGADAKLAAGSFAFRDLPAGQLAVGTPAKVVS